MSPRRGCYLAVTDKALFHNAQFVIIRPIPAAFTFSGGKNFDLRAVDKVRHKVGLTIGANLSSDGRPRRLTSLITEPWIEITDYGILPDDPDAIRSAIRQASASNDIVISSGGVSAGEENHVLDALKREDATLEVLKVAIRPGKPLTIGRVGGALWHVYQVLTKRSSLMRNYVRKRYHGGPVPCHIWLGVSVEDAAHASRIEHLKQINSDARFISFEPLLGPVGNVDLHGVAWAIVGGEITEAG